MQDRTALRRNAELGLQLSELVRAGETVDGRHLPADGFASGICSICTTPARAAYGTWVEDHIVTSSPFHCATTARGSIGTPSWASDTYRPFTTTSATGK